ncbi:unnamed protein product [Vicia faba]|uniref:Polymerase nucleotidyl transferase domain-containing protein n=1 Tax=Vicia faba TaxID=3906 RepID=A0AAV0ZKV2_VICFA|nr:unnamed protein product [Vicia faba]
MVNNNFVPNGLLLSSEKTFVARVLEGERWSQIEGRTTELLQCVQLNHKSEALRNNIITYLKGLITNHVPCQVFEFGSVPLKTYLPDGDIDLTVFGINKILPENFIHEILQIIQNQKENEFAEFRVKEVKLVQAEVKVIKCLIESFAVDISFNQLSGLCSLCFFEEVNLLIGHHHMFKRSVILIKAWCYYESRLLGSNSGLFSTYGLEILVLYIFNLYNNDFAGPLQVLFRFLEFFSNFDWENYCISLSGPVPKDSLPNMIAESPRKDCESQELLLTELFLNACKTCYGNTPRSQENHEKHFVTKHIDIIDPLCADNNLGRSINKGSFFRIKNAIAFGAKRMLRILECTDENLIAEFDYFFKSTWNRNGNGYWIHVSVYNLYIRNKKIGKPIRQESEDEQALASRESQYNNQNPDNQLSDMGLHKEEPDCLNNTASRRNLQLSGYLHALTGQSAAKEEPGVGNMTENSRIEYPGTVKGAKSENNEVVRQKEEEHHLESTTESCTSLKSNGYLQALLGVKKSDASFSSPPPNISFSLDVVQFPELQEFPSGKRSLNLGQDRVDPPAVITTDSIVMSRPEVCKNTPALDSTSETRLSSLLLKPTHPQDVLGPSTENADIFRHENTAAESDALNVHALQSPYASGSSGIQLPFSISNSSHVEASHYLGNQFSDILNGDFVKYWTNLQYGRYCEIGPLEEPLFYLPTSELLMDFQEQYHMNRRPSSSANVVAPVVPDMPPTLAFYSHEGINQSVSFWLPRFSGGTGSFIPNPLAYNQKYYDRQLYNKHQNANYRSERPGNSNFSSRGRASRSNNVPQNLNSNFRERFSSRGQNHYRQREKLGKKKALHQGEGSSSAVNELKIFEKGSKDISPHQS